MTSMTTRGEPLPTSAREDTWRLGSAAIVIPFAFDPLGNNPNVVALAVVVLACIGVLISRAPNGRSNTALIVVASTIVIIAALEVLNSNVPSISTGLIGFRKSATFLLGILIGLGWRGSRIYALRLTWWCLFLTASISLAAHVVFPSLALMRNRSAGKYTALIGGADRMQGLLAGPFHVSLLGAFLVIASLAPGVVIPRLWLRFIAAVVGVACLFLSQVRTGYVAVAVGVLVMAIVTGSFRSWTSRLSGVVILAPIAFLYFDEFTDIVYRNVALGRLLDQGVDDSRFTSRYSAWQASFDLISRAPLLGWGSGSAGDTLKSNFYGGQHVTSHNMFLKYAVEGGLVQFFLFLLLCFALLIAVRPSQDATRFGIAVAIPIMVFGLVGSAVESNPISYGLAVIWGLCAGHDGSRTVRTPQPLLGRGQRGQTGFSGRATVERSSARIRSSP